MGTNLMYNLLVALIIMLLLLMMQLEKLGFIALEKKYDVFATFKKWKDLVENEMVKMLKCLRYDNGGEYYSKEFDIYYSYNGICREKSPKNRMIMEHARCMRLHVGLPLNFLADAINTAIYLINIGPSSSLDGGIPEEAWIGKHVK